MKALLSSDERFTLNIKEKGNKMKISVILPAYNEEDKIGDVINETVKALDDITDSWEIIVVDDG